MMTMIMVVRGRPHLRNHTGLHKVANTKDTRSTRGIERQKPVRETTGGQTLGGTGETGEGRDPERATRRMIATADPEVTDERTEAVCGTCYYCSMREMSMQLQSHTKLMLSFHRLHLDTF